MTWTAQIYKSPTSLVLGLTCAVHQACNNADTCNWRVLAAVQVSHDAQQYACCLHCVLFGMAEGYHELEMSRSSIPIQLSCSQERRAQDLCKIASGDTILLDAEAQHNSPVHLFLSCLLRSCTLRTCNESDTMWVDSPTVTAAQMKST